MNAMLQELTGEGASGGLSTEEHDEALLLLALQAWAVQVNVGHERTEPQESCRLR